MTPTLPLASIALLHQRDLVAQVHLVFCVACLELNVHSALRRSVSFWKQSRHLQVRLSALPTALHLNLIADLGGSRSIQHQSSKSQSDINICFTRVAFHLATPLYPILKSDLRFDLGL